MHVFIGLFLTQDRDKDCDCGSQSGPSFSGSLHCMRRAFIGSILNGTTGEDGGHLLTPAFVPDSGRMNVRFILTSMARMPRAFRVASTQKTAALRVDFHPYELALLCRRSRRQLV